MLISIISKSFPSRPQRPELTQHSNCGSCCLAQWNSCLLEKESSSSQHKLQQPLHQFTPGNKTKASRHESSPRYAPLLFTRQQELGHHCFVICHYLFSCSHKQMGNIPSAGSSLQGWPWEQMSAFIAGTFALKLNPADLCGTGLQRQVNKQQRGQWSYAKIHCAVDFQIWFTISISKEQRRRKT